MKSILILTALCANSVAIATDRSHRPLQILKSAREKYLVKEEADTSFAVNLKNIGIFDEIPKDKARNLLNCRIEKADCYMAEGHTISVP